MNYKSFTLGDWIGHISGVIEDETTLDGNEMRDLVEFLSTLEQESILDKIKEEIKDNTYFINETTEKEGIDFETIEKIIDKYKAESEEQE